jgi:hypothetical protein
VRRIAVLVMVGSLPRWLCDGCGARVVGDGIVVYSRASFRGHYPQPHVCCSEMCAEITEQRLTVQPTHRMAWGEFLKALTDGV